jgi:hypothetical protein
MSGLATLALGAAPLAGGVLIGGMAGNRSPGVADLRGVIKSELELLERIPADELTRRAALESIIGEHVDALVTAVEKSRELRRKVSYFTEHWRDLVLVVCTVLFAVIAWHADHDRARWLPIFIAAILLSVVTATLTLRGFLRSIRPHDQRDRGGHL